MKCLSSFIGQNPESAKTMAYSESDFLLAVCSINVTFHMKKYFHMGESVDYRKDKKELASRKSLKNFCALQSNDEDSFMLLHHAFFNRLFNKWIAVRDSNPKVTLLDFGDSFLKICKAFDSAMNKINYQNVSEFEAEFNKIS